MWCVHTLHRPRSHINRQLAPRPTRNQAPIGLAARKHVPFLAQIDCPDHATFGPCGSSNWNIPNQTTTDLRIWRVHILHHPRSHINPLLARTTPNPESSSNWPSCTETCAISSSDRSPGPCYIRSVWQFRLEYPIKPQQICVYGVFTYCTARDPT